MADNTTPPGLTKPVATDEIGGVDYQRMKLVLGADGVNDGDVSSTNPLPTHDDEAHQLLSFLVRYLESPRGFDKSSNRQRGTVIVESGTVTTVTTITNLSTIDTFQGRLQVLGQNMTAWQAAVRSRIS